jgi:UDP-N-acetylglucosamine 2-epimerase (non-hydrolysing)
VIGLFDLDVNVDLDIMKESQDLFYVTTEIMKGMREILKSTELDFLLVQGDTTTSFVAALSAFYERIPVGHVEAGLRTYDKYQPFPEELNRVFIDDIADLLFPPTPLSRENLIRCGVAPEKILVTGNTGIDSLLWVVEHTRPERGIESMVPEGRKLLLLTCHRRENFGAPVRQIFEAIADIASRDDAFIVYPVHPNPHVKSPAEEMLGGLANVELIEPVDYTTMAHLMSKSYLILTDSGGIQEEAPTFKVPVLILRNKTERPEGIEAGVAKLVGTDRKTIVNEATLLLESREELRKMQSGENPYGDGKASQRIVESIEAFFRKSPRD